METESTVMRWLRKWGFEGAAWSLRRLHCPVDKNALVLEVGAGGNPYPRANVLLDGYEESIERIEKALVKDRPFVLGLAENLPFQSKSFDFVISSHVLEHSSDPEAFLEELMRVGKAGYIETPDAFFERINPFTYHRLEVASINGSGIRIHKKRSWRHDQFMVDEYERIVKTKSFIRYVSANPWSFNMRFYWTDRIGYDVVNPESDCNWNLPEEAYKKATVVAPNGLKLTVRYWFRGLCRWLFSQNTRNQKMDIVSLLRCPTCFGEDLRKNDDALVCETCKSVYPIRNGMPVMVSKKNQS